MQTFSHPTTNQQLVARGEPMGSRPPARIGRYELVRPIGAGGMGTVYEAIHSLLRKRVALKTVHAEQPLSDALLRRFLREAESTARVHHPNIVDVVDVGVEAGVPFMVMELLEGEHLGSLLEREGRLEAQRAVDLIMPALAGLAAAHALGIVHRDIKPDNLFLARDAHGTQRPTLLLDFGVSQEVEGEHTADEPRFAIFSGTPHYMAPEQIRGRSGDPRTDQYALGVVLFQSIAGQRPFEAESLADLLIAIDDGLPPQLSSLCPDLPAGLAAAIHRAMARDIDARFENSQALARALLPYASESVRAAYQQAFEGARRSAPPPARLSEDDLTQCCASLLASVTRRELGAQWSAVVTVEPERAQPSRSPRLNRTLAGLLLFSLLGPATTAPRRSADRAGLRSGSVASLQSEGEEMRAATLLDHPSVRASARERAVPVARALF